MIHMIIRWVWSNRVDGDMRDRAYISLFLRKNSITYPLVLPEQTHGNQVAIVQDSSQDIIPCVDGIITDRHIALGVLTADCLPILLYDKTHGVIGVVHAGWRGAYKNIIKSALDAMRTIGAQRDHIHVIIGPHIRSCCYSVDEQRKELFESAFGSSVIVCRDGRHAIELERVVTLELKEYGISDAKVMVDLDCTSCRNDRYFSYRRDGKESFGEQIAIIWFEK